MKIVYLFPKYPVEREAFASHDIESLKAQGHELRVLSLRRSQNKAAGQRLIQERHVNTLHVENGSSFRGLIWLLIHPLIFMKLVLFLFRASNFKLSHFAKSVVTAFRSASLVNATKSFAPDVVHCFWGHYPSVFLFLLHHSGGCSRTVKSQFLGAYDLNANWKGTIEIANAISDVVITHAEKNRDVLVQKGVDKEKIRVIYRGVQTVAEEQALDKTDSDVIRLVSAGALIQAKRHDRSIDILSELLKAGQAAHLSIAGSGDGQEHLKHYAETQDCFEHVTFHGHLSHSELYELFEKSHYFIGLSEHPNECLPNVVKEAMAHDVIPFVSNTFAIEELVKHGQNGFVTKDDQFIVDQITALNQNTEKRVALGRKARETIRQNFNGTQNMKAYADLWLKILQALQSD